MQVLETPRLRLRPATVHDAEFICALMNEPGYLTHIGDRGVRSAQDACSYLTTAPIYAYDGGLGLNLVETRAGGEPVGVCGLLKREAMLDIEMGYALTASQAGIGYAQEAAAATLEHALATLALPRVLAIVRPSNIRSRRVLEKIGFRLEAVMPHPDTQVNVCLYAISGRDQGAPRAAGAAG